MISLVFRESNLSLIVGHFKKFLFQHEELFMLHQFRKAIQLTKLDDLTHRRSCHMLNCRQNIFAYPICKIINSKKSDALIGSLIYFQNKVRKERRIYIGQVWSMSRINYRIGKGQTQVKSQPRKDASSVSR